VSPSGFEPETYWLKVYFRPKAEALDSKVYAEAMPWFRKAADQGNDDAQLEMGWFHEHGRGVPQGYTEAMRWYRMASDQENHNAQNLIGALYVNGFGVPLDDPEQASLWFRKARGG
jgi:uncharacterized protein